MWLLQAYWFRGEVPFPVAAAVQVLVPAAVTFAAGFYARHTYRADPDATGRHARRIAPDDGDREAW